MKNKIVNRQYFIVTPTKDEEKNLPNLIQSILKQTIKPILWVIVDESCDTTVKIINDLTEKYGWVKAIFLKQDEGYLGIKIGAAYKIGFDFAIEYCRQNDIEYNYIGLIDADVVVDKDFFERLIIELEKDFDLGIVSGGEQWNISGKLVDVPHSIDLPIGAARLYRRKCFDETGGCDATASPDSVSIVKAKLRGWKTRQFKEINSITRRTSSARGYWWGSVREGKDHYFLNYSPVFFLLKIIKYTLKYPYYTGLGLLVGYFGSYIQKKEKIENDEIKNYYRYIRPKEIFRFYLNRFKNTLKK